MNASEDTIELAPFLIFIVEMTELHSPAEHVILMKRQVVQSRWSAGGTTRATLLNLFLKTTASRQCLTTSFQHVLPYHCLNLNIEDASAPASL